VNTTVHIMAFFALLWGAWLIIAYHAQRRFAARLLQVIWAQKLNTSLPQTSTTYILSDPYVVMEHMFTLLNIVYEHHSVGILLRLRKTTSLKRICLLQLTSALQDLALVRAEIHWKHKNVVLLEPQKLIIYVHHQPSLDKASDHLSRILGIPITLSVTSLSV